MTRAEHIAAVGDSLSATFARLLGRVLREVERLLPPVVARAQSGDRSALVRAAQAGATRQQLRDVLRAAGYDLLSETAAGPALDQMTQAVLARRLGRAAAALTPEAAGRIQSLRALAEADLLEEGEQMARTLYQALVRGVFASRTHAQILRDLQAHLDRTEAHLRTLYDTTVSIFSRHVELTQASDRPSTLFAYLGPVDALVRPFCREHLGRVYTRDEIAELDNGQLPNVLLTGGGYNCRHVWTEISAFSALAALHGTAGRMPEIADQLEDLAQRPAA